MNESPQAPKTIETEELRHIDNTNNTDIQLDKVLSDTSEAKVLTKRTEKSNFKVTPAMTLYVDTAIKIISDSPSEISQNCSVSRGMWYIWTKKYPNFEEWFYSQYRAKRYRWLPQLDKMGMNRAPKNFDYWQAMNRKAGDLIEEGQSQARTVVSILGGMTVQTINNNNVTPVDETSTKE